MTQRWLGHSLSKLDLTEKCGTAGLLKSASGRSAVMSKWVHATGAGKIEEARGLYSQLDPDERSRCLEWSVPNKVEIGGTWWEYADAEVEVQFSILPNWMAGNYDDPDRFTRGIADIVWRDDLGDCLIVGDMKASRWTTSAGTDTLQLHAAGLALAAAYGLSSYVPFLWYLTDGEGEVGRVVELDSPEATRLRKRIGHAAQNREGPVTGEYCSKCYARWSCPAWSLPAHDTETWLAPLTGSEIQLDDEKAARLALALQVYDDVSERAWEQLKAYVSQGGRIATNGKEYRATQCKGRTSLHQVKLAERLSELGENLEDYKVQGLPWQRWGWYKEKK